MHWVRGAPTSFLQANLDKAIPADYRIPTRFPLKQPKAHQIQEEKKP